METTIPFDGFYNSEYSELIDFVIEDYFTDDHGEVNKAIAEKVFDNTDYKGAYIEAAKIYTAYFASEYNIKVTFKELVSPREYNFTTDRIFCDIELAEVERLYREVDGVILDQVVKKNFTSYDGFISHYSNILGTWGTDLSEWDHNQIGTLIEAYMTMDSSIELDIYELREKLSNSLADYITDFSRYSKLARYINDRDFRE